MRNLLLVSALALIPAGVNAQGGLSAARALYATAAYEEALASLSAPEPGADPNQVDEYRALCYLALGQGPAAEQALERILNRAPAYALNELDVSPKLVTMFQTVKHNVIPAIARKLYTEAKSNFESADFTQAASKFRLLMAAVDENTSDTGLADIRQLADGFLRLSEAAGAAATLPPPAVTSPVESAPTPVPPPSRIYSVADLDVKPPTAVDQQMPRWSPTAQFTNATINGLLEIVVDERGDVVSASLLQASGTAYDAQLLSAARRWHFRPATRSEKPVKYRKPVGFVLQPLSAAQSGRPGD